jgi:hypothetical protein
MSTAGKTINEMTSDIAIPALIIQPRLITGWIWEKRSEVNPAMVVRMAKKVGVAFESMVSKMSLLDEAWGYFVKSSSYLTIRCKTMEIVIISCKAIKFEEMTVISHPKNPKLLVMAMMDSVQIRIGSITHLGFLKTIPKTRIRRSIRILP